MTADPAARYDGSIELLRTPDRRSARILALVLHARRVPHAVKHEGRDWILVAPAEVAAVAAAELEQYERENADWPPRSDPFDPLADGTLAVAGYVAVLVLLFLLDHTARFDAGLTDHGRALAGRIREGEWWRAFTALTLHVDLVHLVGNLFFGSLFLAQITHVLGTGLAVSSFVLAGAIGNIANAWIQSPDHASVGASTAVFGAIGLLSAHRWQQKSRTTRDRVQRWGPLLVAFFFLGYLGVEGERTDVMAHVTGLFAGIGLGALLGRFSPRLVVGRWKWMVDLWGPGVLALAWWLALR